MHISNQHVDYEGRNKNQYHKFMQKNYSKLIKLTEIEVDKFSHQSWNLTFNYYKI